MLTLGQFASSLTVLPAVTSVDGRNLVLNAIGSKLLIQRYVFKAAYSNMWSLTQVVQISYRTSFKESMHHAVDFIWIFLPSLSSLLKLSDEHSTLSTITMLHNLAKF